MTGVLRGEVQQLVGGRWRIVLTAGGIPVVDHRRRPAGDPVGPDLPTGVQFGFDGSADGHFVLFDPAGGGFWSWSP